MASLTSRLTDLINAIGADIKKQFSNVSVASSTAPNPIGDVYRSIFTITALAAPSTFGLPAGTETDGNSLIVRIKDNGTARALTWNAIYRSLDTTNLPLPTTTVAGKWLYLGFVYNGTDSVWDLVSVLKQT